MSDFSRCLSINGKWDQKTGTCRSRTTGMIIFSASSPYQLGKPLGTVELDNPWTSPKPTGVGTNPWIKPAPNYVLDAFNKQKELDKAKAKEDKEEKVEEKPKGWKAMHIGTKIAIIGGGVLLMTLIVVALIPSSSKNK